MNSQVLNSMPADKTTASRLGISVMEGMQIKFRELVPAGAAVGAEGLKIPVKGVALRRNTRVRFLENAGIEDALFIGGQRNGEITELSAFRLDERLKELEERLGVTITDLDVFRANLELEISPDMSVLFLVRLEQVEEPIRFEIAANTLAAAA